jgi:hypothetical protein
MRKRPVGAETKSLLPGFDDPQSSQSLNAVTPTTDAHAGPVYPSPNRRSPCGTPEPVPSPRPAVTAAAGSRAGFGDGAAAPFAASPVPPVADLAPDVAVGEAQDVVALEDRDVPVSCGSCADVVALCPFLANCVLVWWPDDAGVGLKPRPNLPRYSLRGGSRGISSGAGRESARSWSERVHAHIEGDEDGSGSGRGDVAGHSGRGRDGGLGVCGCAVQVQDLRVRQPQRLLRYPAAEWDATVVIFSGQCQQPPIAAGSVGGAR